MTIEIKRDGVMHITPETELERYALKKWCEDNKETIMNMPNILFYYD